MRNSVSAVSITQALKNIDFPANTKDLVKQAQSNNASDDVIEAIRNLANQQFQNMADIERAFGEEKRAAS